MADEATKTEEPGVSGPPMPRLPKLLRVALHLPNFVKLYQRLFADRRVPIWAKAVPVAAIIYVAWPVDFIPIIPGVSWIDDAAVAILALWAFPKLCPSNVVAEHVAAIDRGA